MKIDMRYLYGRDVGQILNIRFAPDTYFVADVALNTTTGANTFYLIALDGWESIKVYLFMHIKKNQTELKMLLVRFLLLLEWKHFESRSIWI